MRRERHAEETTPHTYCYIYLINDLIFHFLRNNVDNEEERGFDACVQQFFCDILKKDVIPFFRRGDELSRYSGYAPSLVYKDGEEIIQFFYGIEKMGEKETFHLKMEAYFSFL